MHVLSGQAGPGITRVSIGAQSFQPVHLKALERWHAPESVGRAVGIAREAGIERVSLDLIYAIPGQSLDQWASDLARAIAMHPEHLSCYNLTYEPGTPLTARRDRGQVQPLDEDAEVEMYTTTVRTLADAGLGRYEVSNFARAGAECRHNLAYWRCEPYLAAGPSASGCLAGHRWKNVPDLPAYLVSDGLSLVIDHEPPDPRRALAERIMMGLRLAEGLDAPAVLAEAADLGSAVADRLADVVSSHVRGGRLVEASGRWLLTDAGYLMADGVASDLMATLNTPD
jgi:oxygen-independent coproporphyrinogen-3 oxidase